MQQHKRECSELRKHVLLNQRTSQQPHAWYDRLRSGFGQWLYLVQCQLGYGSIGVHGAGLFSARRARAHDHKHCVQPAHGDCRDGVCGEFGGDGDRRPDAVQLVGERVSQWDVD